MFCLSPNKTYGNFFKTIIKYLNKDVNFLKRSMIKKKKSCESNNLMGDPLAGFVRG